MRRFIRRGTVLIQVRVDRPFSAQDYRINIAALQGYVEQIRTACAAMPQSLDPEKLLGQVLALPGVAPENGGVAASIDDEWPAIERVVVEALEQLQAFRQQEGGRMAHELLTYRAEISEHLEYIGNQVPKSVAALRDRFSNACAPSGRRRAPRSLRVI